MRGPGSLATVAVCMTLLGASASVAQDPSAGAAGPAVAPAPSAEAAGSAVAWDSGSVRFEADSFELRIGDKVFRGSGPAEVDSDPGDTGYRTLEVAWHELESLREKLDAHERR